MGPFCSHDFGSTRRYAESKKSILGDSQGRDVVLVALPSYPAYHNPLRTQAKGTDILTEEEMPCSDKPFLSQMRSIFWESLAVT